MNARAIRWLLGSLCLLLSVAFLVPAAVSLGCREGDVARIFAALAVATAAIGAGLAASGRGSLHAGNGRPAFFRREGMAAVALIWAVASLLGAVPFLASGVTASPVDALFESVSGFTTTGATVFSGERIDRFPRGINFWRCYSQWLGGIGIVVVFVTVLPVGGRSLFRSEGIDRRTEESRVKQAAMRLVRVYIALTGACAALFLACGLGPFDACAHAFTTLSTGGFSSRGASMGHYGSWLAELVCVVFMVIGGTNLGLWTTLERRGLRQAMARAGRSTELRVYVALLGGLVGAVTVMLWFWGGSNGASGSDLEDYRRFLHALRHATFNVVSLQTTTGLATTDFDRWPDACRVLLMLAAVVGACVGSTGGGIKVLRLVLLARGAMAGLRSYGRPRAIVHVRADGEVLDRDAVLSTMYFLALYALVAGAGVLALTVLGVAPQEAITGVIACFNTTGPGLGRLGPSLSFGDLDAASKLVLCALMLLGRLECYVLISLVMRSFWR